VQIYVQVRTLIGTKNGMNMPNCLLSTSTDSGT